MVDFLAFVLDRVVGVVDEVVGVEAPAWLVGTAKPANMSTQRTNQDARLPITCRDPPRAGAACLTWCIGIVTKVL